MAKQGQLTVKIDSGLKQDLLAFCKKSGLAVQEVIERSIREQLEEAGDLEAYNARKDEVEVPIEEVLKILNKLSR